MGNYLSKKTKTLNCNNCDAKSKKIEEKFEEGALALPQAKNYFTNFLLISKKTVYKSIILGSDQQLQPAVRHLLCPPVCLPPPRRLCPRPLMQTKRRLRVRPGGEAGSQGAQGGDPAQGTEGGGKSQDQLPWWVYFCRPNFLYFGSNTF